MKKSALSLLLVLVGCSTTTVPAPIALNPEDGDQLNFEAFTKYYCTQGDWPTTMVAARKWADTAGVPHEFDEYVDAQITSPRKILMTVDYAGDSTTGERMTVSFIAPPYCTNADPATPKEIDPSLVSMAGGGVTFTLSPEYDPLDADEMKERWGEGPYPDVAWESDATNLLVTARFGEVDVQPDQLKTLQAPLEAAYAQSAKNIVWKVRKFGKIGGIAWIRLGYESDSSKGRLYNTSLTTTFHGKLFTLSFTSPIEKGAELLQLSKDVVQSIAISAP